MSDSLVINSHKGEYTVDFNNEILIDVPTLLAEKPHFIIDKNVARIYENELQLILKSESVIIIEATENNKTIDKIIPVFEKLVRNKIRREHVLVAIGGGIIQDITCFIASTLLRGIPWRFVPTTLLAQADSCIGSKSSINLTDTKNILGTFNPPKDIFISAKFLDTLETKEIKSGIGEIIKVHAIEGISDFDRLASDFDCLSTDRAVLLKYIYSSLRIKKKYIEMDEFDRGIRNIFNYGHSFGHAIESATNYKIPHGIAVSIGMNMANYISTARGLLPMKHFERMQVILKKNFFDYVDFEIPFDSLMLALSKDKKNTSTKLGLIFPVGDNAEIQRIQVTPDEEFQMQCKDFLSRMSV